MQSILQGTGIREESLLFLYVLEIFRMSLWHSLSWFVMKEMSRKEIQKGKKKVPEETLNSSWLGGFRHNWSALVPGGYLQWKSRLLQFPTRVLVIVGAVWLDMIQYQEESGRVIKVSFFITEQFFWRMTSLDLKGWLIG